jgi:AAA+ superfamily predicted ATPase
MGIKPPKGVILYGQPGTGKSIMTFSYILFLWLIKGKTLLAKAVANQTSATFLRVVGSELIQKYLVINSLDFLIYLFFRHISRAMDQNSFVNYFELLKNMLQRLYLSMKSMLSEQNGRLSYFI